MIMKRFLAISCWLLAVGLIASAQQRQEQLLSDGWQFSRDKQQWETVRIPHDWAIAGPFDKKWDLQKVAITQNGETEPTEKSGRSGALPWIGEGYYKRTLTIPAGTERAELVFDGAMAEPTVFVNGQKAGYWAYGYNTFRVDVTPFVKAGDNLLEVSLKNEEESSRWYPGAGIYRPVTLITTRKSHLDDWSIYIRTITVDNKGAKLEAEGRAVNATPSMTATISVADAQGVVVAAKDMKINADGSFHTQLTVQKPELWSPEHPYLYQVTTTLKENGKMVDSKTLKTGIRTIRVTRENGFQLNGVSRKIKGVCLHHDLGPLGAAVNKAALIRQIKMMKQMGCDAIRTSHNMPSQMQMDICDSLGMMVMAESFDMWVYPKCKNGYARFFHEWADKDITNLVVANRNHPAIVMWSIGNEIPEQGMEGGRQMASHLQDLCHQLDPTRPVTQGCDRPDNAVSTGFLAAMDVPGLNYRLHRYQDTFDHLWHVYLLGSETTSTVSSRGVYKFPVKTDDNSRYSSWAKGYDPKAIKEADGQCSGYDVEYCAWSNLPDDDWRWQDDKPWVIGEFVWTGYDYLGEPTPFDEYWPSRSSYFGICDLAGLPKDRYYLYRSYPTAELFVNGKSQGKISKNTDQRLDRYRLRWNDVKYEPGEVKVVVYDASDRKVGEKTMCTAGKPAQLKLDVWTQHQPSAINHQPSDFLLADGEDLAFVTVSLTDKQGTLIPDAADQLDFEVTGAGSFEAVCNGDATSLESFKQPTMKLFHGQLVVVVRSAKHTGTLTLTVKDKQRKLTKKVALSIKN